MKLRFWSAGAKSGTVGDELTVSGSGSLVNKLGGGTCTIGVDLTRLRMKDSDALDVGALERLLDQTQPGLRSIVVTDEQKRILGEWVVMRRPKSTEGDTFDLSVMEWDGYPALRSLHASYDVTADQLTIARTLLTDAFLTYNTGMQLTIPAQTSGRVRKLKKRTRSAYYSDALSEIGDQDGGFEWRVDFAGTWSGDRLVSVQRTVVFGSPTLSRATSIDFWRPPYGSRGGSAIEVSGGGEDFARYAQSVYGIGAGENEKQRIVGLSDPTLTNAGYLNSTKNVTFSGVEDLAALERLTRAKLVEAQDLRDPFDAVGIIEKLSALPRVGDLVRLRSAPVPAWPKGLDVQGARVGEVKIAFSGHEAELLSVQAI